MKTTPRHRQPTSQGRRAVIVMFAVAMTMGCGTRPGTSADTIALTADARAAVELPADGQQAVLAEMRRMLAAIGGAMHSAASADTAALLAALATVGNAAAADPALEALLPPAWKELAEQTHSGFDSLTAAVRRSRTSQSLKDTVLVRLAAISGACATCHEIFRLPGR